MINFRKKYQFESSLRFQYTLTLRPEEKRIMRLYVYAAFSCGIITKVFS